MHWLQEQARRNGTEPPTLAQMEAAGDSNPDGDGCGCIVLLGLLIPPLVAALGIAGAGVLL